MDQQKKEVIALTVLFSIDCALLFFNLIFALYISAVYFCRLQVKAPFIILFYVFADLTTFFRLVECIFIVVDLVHHDGEDQIIYLFTETKVEICRSVAYLTFLGVGIVVVSTMFQIALSLRMVSGEIEIHVAHKLLHWFYAVMSLIMIFAAGIELFLHVYYDENI